MPRSINAAGLALIRQFEGCRLTAYYDGNGKLTIGWGHKVLPSDNIKPGETITQARADALLQADLAQNAAWLEDDLDGIEVNDNQFSALLSLEFNIGVGRFEDSTLLDDLDDGDFDSAAEQFAVWRMIGGQISDGLVRRRKAERALFLTPIEEPATHNID
jgi:lysozyme